MGVLDSIRSLFSSRRVARGRGPKFSQAEREYILDLAAMGYGPSEIAAEVGRDRNAIARLIARHRDAEQEKPPDLEAIIERKALEAIATDPARLDQLIDDYLDRRLGGGRKRRGRLADSLREELEDLTALLQVARAFNPEREGFGAVVREIAQAMPQVAQSMPAILAALQAQQAQATQPQAPQVQVQPIPALGQLQSGQPGQLGSGQPAQSPDPSAGTSARTSAGDQLQSEAEQSQAQAGETLAPYLVQSPFGPVVAGVLAHVVDESGQPRDPQRAAQLVDTWLRQRGLLLLGRQLVAAGLSTIQAEFVRFRPHAELGPIVEWLGTGAGQAWAATFFAALFPLIQAETRPKT